MATITTKQDVRIQGSQYSKVWKSITLANADVLVTGFVEVWEVHLSDPSKWAAGGWTVGTGASRGKVTFNLGGAFTGRLVVYGR